MSIVGPTPQDNRELADEILTLASQWIGEHSGEGAGEGDARRAEEVLAIMKNVAEGTDLITEDQDLAQLNEQLLSLVKMMRRVLSEDYPHAADANLVVALESSGRLVPNHVRPPTGPQAATTGEDEARGQNRRPWLIAAVLAAVLAAGGLGYVVGDASGAASGPATRTSQASAEDAGRFMAVLNAIRDDWKPRLEALAQTRGAIGEANCSGQINNLDSWTKQLEAVFVDDSELKDAAARYLGEMRALAVDCDGSGPNIRANYLSQQPLLDKVMVRATTLGWSPSG